MGDGARCEGSVVLLRQRDGQIRQITGLSAAGEDCAYGNKKHKAKWRWQRGLGGGLGRDGRKRMEVPDLYAALWRVSVPDWRLSAKGRRRDGVLYDAAAFVSVLLLKF